MRFEPRKGTRKPRAPVFRTSFHVLSKAPPNDRCNSAAALVGLAERAGKFYRRSSEDWLACGNLLLEAKKVCQHGEWSVFLEDAGIGCTCYHPLFVFNQFGDLERCALRPGNVHSAHEWRDVLDPVVARYRNKTPRRYFRGDAAFASPEVYEFLEAEGFKYAIRLPANKVLHDSIAHLLKRPRRSAAEGSSSVLRELQLSGRYDAVRWGRPLHRIDDAPCTMPVLACDMLR